MNPKPFFNYVVESIFVGIPLCITLTYIYLSIACGAGSGCMESPEPLLFILGQIIITVFILALILRKISDKSTAFKVVSYGIIIVLPLLYSWQNIYTDFIGPVFLGY